MEKGTNPLQSNDLSSYKDAFQTMLMSSNNKMIELLKNKKTIAEMQAPNVSTVPKGILKNTVHKMGSSQEDETPKKQNIKFKPLACSTQLDGDLLSQKTPNNTKVNDFDTEDDLPRKKTKKKKKERISDSDCSETKHSTSSVQAEKKVLKRSHDVDSDSDQTQLQKKAKKRKRSEIENASDNSEIKKKKHKAKETNKSERHLLNLEEMSNTESDSKASKKNKHKKQQNVSASYSKYEDNETSSDSDFQGKSPLKKPVLKNKSTKSIELLKQHQEKFALSEVQEESNVLNDIRPDEELFFIQIPKSFDPKHLEGLEIDLNEKTRFSSSGRKYDCIPTNEPQKINLLSGCSQMQSVVSHGTIKIVRHLKLKHLPDMSGNWENNVKFPSNLKQRHPLFGADYNDKISLEDHIKQKLQAAIESNEQGKKKNRKKKRPNEDSKTTKSIEEEDIFKFLQQSSGGKAGTSGAYQGESKIKKEKKDKNYTDVSSTMFDLNETFTHEDDKSGKRKKIKKQIKEEVDESDFATHTTSKEKKKHKKDKASKNTDGQMDLINEMLLLKNKEILDSLYPNSKKKKKSKTKE